MKMYIYEILGKSLQFLIALVCIFMGTESALVSRISGAVLMSILFLYLSLAAIYQSLPELRSTLRKQGIFVEVAGIISVMFSTITYSLGV